MLAEQKAAEEKKAADALRPELETLRAEKEKHI